MHRLYNISQAIVYRIKEIASLSPILKRTNWYKNFFLEDIYPGNKWYREHPERNFDLVVLGSSSAKWAFDFSDSTLKTMNWAQQPQTLVEDYNLLRNFHSILRKNGIVIITIMPFTGLNKKTGIHDALKYLKIHSHEPIEPLFYSEAKRIERNPVLFGKPALKAFVKYLMGKDVPPLTYDYAMVNNNPMNDEQLEENARLFIEGWKRQFGIKDWEAILTPENHEGRQYRIELMRTIIDFLRERSYQPIFVIPPVTKHLSKYFTPSFNEIYVYSFLRGINRDVKLLDYSRRKEFQADDLFFNSFFLNKKGRKFFSRQILLDLGLDNCSR